MKSPVTFVPVENSEAVKVLFNGSLRYFLIPSQEIVKVRQTQDGQSHALIIADKDTRHETGHVWLN